MERDNDGCDDYHHGYVMFPEKSGWISCSGWENSRSSVQKPNIGGKTIKIPK